MKVRKHIWVSGHVQGVSFRFYAMDLAKKLAVNGWVRNLSDGRVEALLEGEEQSVAEIIEFCERGPPGAHVTEVEVSNEKFLNEFSGFKVRY